MTQGQLTSAIQNLKATVDTFPAKVQAIIDAQGIVAPELESAFNELSTSVNNVNTLLPS